MNSTRRTILHGLAVLPAATLPAGAASVLAANPDSALIAFAAEGEALALRHNAAFAQWGDLDEELDRRSPECPVAPPTPTKYNTSVEHGPGGVMTIRSLPAPIDPAADLAKAQHDAAVEAYEIEREAIRHSLGLHVADQLHRDLYRDLELAVDSLTLMAPQTLAGLIAKARAAVALDPDDCGTLNGWEHAIMAAVVRDVVRIGGGA